MEGPPGGELLSFILQYNHISTLTNNVAGNIKNMLIKFANNITLWQQPVH